MIQTYYPIKGANRQMCQWRKLLFRGILPALLCLLCFLRAAPAEASELTADGPRLAVSGRGTLFAAAPDGSLYGWGEPDFHLLGEEQTAVSYENRRLLLKNTAAVKASTFTVLALDTDGTLWGWGSAAQGQLTGEPSEASEPQKLMEQVISFAAGTDHSAAVTADGVLWTWGSNARGQLGLGTCTNELYRPQRVMKGIASVSIAGDITFAVTQDGDLYGWGGVQSGVSAGQWGETPGGLPRYLTGSVSDIAEAASGSYLVLLRDGTLTLWTLDTGPEGIQFQTFSQTKTLDSPVQSLCGLGYIRADGSFWGWPLPPYGEPLAPPQQLAPQADAAFNSGTLAMAVNQEGTLSLRDLESESLSSYPQSPDMPVVSALPLILPPSLPDAPAGSLCIPLLAAGCLAAAILFLLARQFLRKNTGNRRKAKR